MDYFVMVGEGKHPIMPIAERPDYPGNWTLGLPVQAPTKPLVYTLDSDYDGNPKVMYYECAIPIMRSDLVELIKSCGVENVQFFPSLLKNPKTGEVLTNYQAYNIVGLVSCVDRTRSKIVPSLSSGKEDLFFESLYIDESKAKGLIFRLAENSGTIIVHRKIKDAVKTAKIPGIEFY